MVVEKVIREAKKTLKDFLAPERFVLAICLQAIFRRLLPSAKTKFGTVYFLPKVYNKNMALKCTGAASLRQTEGAVIVLQYADAKVGDAAEVNVREIYPPVLFEENLTDDAPAKIKVKEVILAAFNSARTAVKKIFLQIIFLPRRWSQRNVSGSSDSAELSINKHFYSLLTLAWLKSPPPKEDKEVQPKQSDDLDSGEEGRETALFEVDLKK